MDGCGAGGDAGATPVVSTGAARGFLKIGAMRITAFASASMVRSGPQGPPLALRLGTVHEYEDSRLAGRAARWGPLVDRHSIRTPATQVCAKSRRTTTRARLISAETAKAE
jgi:hypothetical protein